MSAMTMSAALVAGKVSIASKYVRVMFSVATRVEGVVPARTIYHFFSRRPSRDIGCRLPRRNRRRASAFSRAKPFS
jgi:hypothetical protein